MLETDSRKQTLPKLRPFIQGFFFLFFLFLFWRVSFPFTEDLTKNFFFNLDPLILFGLALSGSLVLTALLASLATVLVTVFFGRIFCGWICPMGSVFDFFARYIPERKKEKNYGKGKYKNGKYYLLSFFVFGSLFGLTFALFLDPMVFFFRVLTLNVYPPAVYAANFFLDLIRPAALSLGFIKLSMLSFQQPVFDLALFSLLLFLGAVGLISLERRFWCRNICPLGALLSLLARFSPWGRKVSDACSECSKCAKACPMNAIAETYTETSAHECIQCERCETVCPVDAISFGFQAPGEQKYSYSPSRRGMLISAAGGILAASAAVSAVPRQIINPSLIRPPGALVEKDFLNTCVRCGECMKACPTHGLQPAILQAGFEGFYTPVLMSRVGGCEDKCNLCGKICPTGAIRNLPLLEKQYAVMGNATIERNLCIAWEQGKLCLICDEICPYDAVEFRMVTDEKCTIQRPYVIEDKCVGCGMCEKACPVKGKAAIFVTPINEVRKNNGSYITEKVKRLRTVKDDNVDYYKEIRVESGGKVTQPAPSASSAPADSMPENELPPGFVK
ncbi:MAG: 4Fe-4S binding protein [Candidatus Latescibacter sp.]|nr:4Fe-4S binding protein [Candidatus Latescibacter sp.]